MTPGKEDAGKPLAPADAAETYAEEWLDDHDSHTHLVVEPLDDEAKALAGWQEDEEGPFMLFRAAPEVTWNVEAMGTFRGKS